VWVKEEQWALLAVSFKASPSQKCCQCVANVLPMCCQCVANVLLTPVLRGNTFSKVLSLVTLSGKYTRALTSENFCFVFKDSAIMYRSEGMFVQAFAMLDEVCCVSNVLLMC